MWQKKVNSFLLISSLLFMHTGFAVFDTLTEIRTYAQNKNEYPKMDNTNLLNPDYSSFYKQEVPSFYNKILSFFGWGQKSMWRIEDFQLLLQKVTQQREGAGRKGDFVEKIIPDNASHIVIFGDMQGAFHSLVRDLDILHTLDIVDDNLVIKKNSYLVFNGDFIDRSAYDLETLTLILKLMERNPDRVFYMRGNHESNQHWYNYSLKQALIFRGHTISSDVIPLGSLVTHFFDTLPLALYIRTKDKLNKPCVVRISHYGMYETEDTINEDHMAEFLLSNVAAQPSFFYLKDQKDTGKYVQVKALVRGESRSTTYNLTNGLQMMAPEKGATTWTLLSAPTTVYQQMYQFYYDAFAIMQVSSFVDDWIFDFYNRDVRTKESDFKKSIFNVLRGVQFASEKDVINYSKKYPGRADALVLGSINDFSKGASGHAERLRRGLVLRMNQANRESQLPHNRYYELVMFDDEYTPALAVKSAHVLMDKYKGDIVILTVGAPSHEALIPFMKQHELLVLFNFAGSMLFRVPDLTYNVHYRASYEREGAALVQYAVNQLKRKTFVIAYQNDSFGKALRNGARAALQKLGAKWAEASYNRNTINVTDAVQTIKEFDPEVILWFGVRTAFLALIQQLGIAYVSEKKLMGSSFLTDIFRDMIKPRGLSLMLTRVVPDPMSDIEIAKEYRAAVERYMPGAPITVDDFEAYIDGTLLTYAIQQIKEGPVTKERIIEEFHKMKNISYKGLKLNYDPQTQELGANKDIWVDSGTEWFYVPREQTEIGQDPKAENIQSAKK